MLLSYNDRTESNSESLKEIFYTLVVPISAYGFKENRMKIIVIIISSSCKSPTLLSHVNIVCCQEGCRRR